MKIKTRKLFYGWIITASCYVYVVTFMASFYTFGIFFKPISGELGWSRAQTSLAISINLMTGGIIAILAGRLIDRYNPRNIMLASSVLAGITYILMSKITNLGQLYLLYGLALGAAMSAYYVVPSVLMNRWFIKKRGLGLGIVFSAFGSAQVISPPIAVALIDSLGWRQMYIYMGITVFVITTLSAFFLRSSPEEMGLLPDGDTGEKPIMRVNLDPHVNNTSKGLTVRETLHTSTFWLISLLWLFMAFPFYILVVHLIPYSTDVGINIVAAASILTIAGVSNIIGRITLGHISDKFGSKIILLVSFIAIIFGLLLLTSARNLTTFYVAVILVTLFIQGGDTVVIKALGDLFGVRSLGFIVGVTSLAFRLGSSLGAYLAGFFFDITQSYAIIFSMAAVAIYVCFILTFFIFSNKRHIKSSSGKNPLSASPERKPI